MVGRPAVGEHASLEMSPGRVHDEAWAGRVQSSSLRISQEVEIETGCAVSVSYLPSPFFSPASPGPGKEVRSWIGWTRPGKTARSVCGFPALSAAGDWVKRRPYRTAFRVFAHTRMDKARLSGHSLDGGAGWTVEGYRTSDEAVVC